MFKVGQRLITTGLSVDRPRGVPAGTTVHFVRRNNFNENLYQVALSDGSWAWFYHHKLKTYDDPKELICEDWS